MEFILCKQQLNIEENYNSSRKNLEFKLPLLKRKEQNFSKIHIRELVHQINFNSNNSF